jgi:hypothetical protein
MGRRILLKMTQMCEIAEGLNYLHSLAIIHGDVNHVSDLACDAERHLKHSISRSTSSLMINIAPNSPISVLYASQILTRYASRIPGIRIPLDGHPRSVLTITFVQLVTMCIHMHVSLITCVPFPSQCLCRFL